MHVGSNLPPASSVVGDQEGACTPRPRISLVITDLDNTLWDWVAVWHAGFAPMLERIVEISGLPRDLLERDIQSVFRRHGTSEYSGLIEEIDCLREKHPSGALVQIYHDAIMAYREGRAEALRLYPGVLPALQKLANLGCPVVAYTESMGFYTTMRIKKLGLDGLIRAVYSPADHGRPAGNQRTHEDDWYELGSTVHRTTASGELKPNPHILRSIIETEGQGTPPCEALYIGDSPHKDVRMAQTVGAVDVLAQYGQAHDTAAYELLRRVTHWTDEDVRREREILASGDVQATYVLDSGFDQLLERFEFVVPPARSRGENPCQTM